MSTITKDDRQGLEQRALLIRSKLLGTIDALDRRRHELTHATKWFRRHGRGLAFAAGVMVVALGAAYALAGPRFGRRRRDRIQAARRLWKHPERLSPSRPFFVELGRRLLLSALTFAAMNLTKRGWHRALGSPFDENARLPKLAATREEKASLKPPDPSAFAMR